MLCVQYMVVMDEVYLVQDGFVFDCVGVDLQCLIDVCWCVLGLEYFDMIVLMMLQVCLFFKCGNVDGVDDVVCYGFMVQVIVLECQIFVVYQW